MVKRLIIFNLEDDLHLEEGRKRPFGVMRFTGRTSRKPAPLGRQ